MDCSNDDNWYAQLEAMHFFQYGEAALTRKIQVKNQHRWQLLPELHQCLCAIFCRTHGIGGTHQHSTQHISDDDVIFNKENITECGHDTASLSQHPQAVRVAK